jgi:hypothetical protein
MLVVLIGCAVATGCAGTKHEPIMAGCSMPHLQNDVPTKTSASTLDNHLGVSIHQSMRNNPKAYTHVVVAPIWFSAAADCDRSFSSNELARITSEAGRETAAIITQGFTNKGYHVIGPGGAICSDGDLNALDAETCALLAQVRGDFRQLNLDIHGATNPPICFKLNTPLPLLTKLCGSQADALVLVDSTAYLETSHQRHQRYTWNGTGGPLLTAGRDALLASVMVLAIAGGAGGAPDMTLMAGTALMSNPNYIHQTIAIIDLRTQDVLFWNSTSRKGKDLREPDQLKAALAALLSGIYPIARETGKE